MKIGLYFGSFNPVHLGHLITANHLLAYSDLEELWFVLSPQSPFKPKDILLDYCHRLEMLRLALDGYSELRVCDIEFNLPKPSYTATTLTHLVDAFPQHRFGMVMGTDNLQAIHKWKDYETILKNHVVYACPRLGSRGGNWVTHPDVRLMDTPIVQISATQIREMIRAGKNVKPLLPCEVFPFLEQHGFYR